MVAHALYPNGEETSLRPMFENAPFPLYGLPVTWRGDRQLGGAHRVGDRIMALSLAHGADWDIGPCLSVETADTNITGWGGTELGFAVEKMWAGFGDDSELQGVRFDLMVVTVEGDRVEFNRAWRGEEWLARAMIKENRVTLRANNFPTDGVELVRVADLSEYTEQ